MGAGGNMDEEIIHDNRSEDDNGNRSIVDIFSVHSGNT